jgi:hypothetical protein
MAPMRSGWMPSSDPEPVTERLSGNASILGLLGWCNYRLRRYDEAIRLYKSLLARSFDSGPRSLTWR